MVGHAERQPEELQRPLRLRFPARAENLSLIRRALARIGPERMRWDATLLTNELVTNSLRHADLGPGDIIDVVVDWSGAVLRVVVTDSGSASVPDGTVAGSIRPAPGAQSGWGLYLVDTLAARWGTNLGGAPGFWFELEDPRRGATSA